MRKVRFLTVLSGLDGRRAGPGTGLGLFVPRKIALALGGGLDLDSDPGTSEGTAFPLSIAGSENRGDHVAASRLVSLWQDDKPALRKTIRGSLAASGFTVEEAATGGEAVGVIQRQLSIWCCWT